MRIKVKMPVTLLREEAATVVGSLQPLTATERTAIAKKLNLPEESITHKPIYKISGDLAWKPTFFDIVDELVNSLPASHSADILQRYFTGDKMNDTIARAELTAQRSENEGETVFTLDYKYHDFW